MKCYDVRFLFIFCVHWKHYLLFLSFWSENWLAPHRQKKRVLKNALYNFFELHKVQLMRTSSNAEKLLWKALEKLFFFFVFIQIRINIKIVKLVLNINISNRGILLPLEKCWINQYSFTIITNSDNEVKIMLDCEINRY